MTPARRPTARVAVAVVALSAATAATCARKSSYEPAAVVVRAPAGSSLDLEVLAWRGPVRAVARRGLHGVELLAEAGSKIHLSHPQACDLTVDTTDDAEIAREVVLTPKLEVDDQLQVGFAAPFELTATHQCPGTGAGRFEWTQVAGPTLEGLTTTNSGAVLRGRTHTLDQLHPGLLPWGIAPLSPATRGEYAFEVSWQGEANARVVTTVRVTAAARTSGVPSVAVGHRLLLGGKGWRVAERPHDAKAEVVGGARGAWFVPDHVGGWLLKDENAKELMLRVGRFDDTPLDCGRRECHPVATRDAQATRMTNTFAFDLAGRFTPADRIACALACHTVGEEGLDDGGFTQVQAALGIALPNRGAAHLWDQLPRDLRRLGGVGCTGCHGPAAIPTPGLARTVLRSDVCAVCHDAPPRYGHVAAWRETRMARADADPRTHEEPCTRCHTTAGFLEWQDAEFLDWQKASPANDAAHIEAGVSCAACHDPHGGPTAARLVRAAKASPLLSTLAEGALGTSVICVPCHAPLAEPGRGGPALAAPAASAALVWLGRGGLRIEDGAAIKGPTQHADVAQGCLGCHRAGPEGAELERGAGHAFVAERSGCVTAPCHEDPQTADGAALAAELTQRARSLLGEIGKRLGSPRTGGNPEDPPHATALALPASSALARAYYDVALVAEDPAAAYHNAAYARALLDEVEAWLARGAR